MKKCAKCNQTKDLSEFYSCRRGRQGKDNYCKICRKEYDKEKYLNNTEYIIAQNSIYQQNNNEKYKEYQRKYRQFNKNKTKPKPPLAEI